MIDIFASILFGFALFMFVGCVYQVVRYDIKPVDALFSMAVSCTACVLAITLIMIW